LCSDNVVRIAVGVGIKVGIEEIIVEFKGDKRVVSEVGKDKVNNVGAVGSEVRKNLLK
jgi:hypothetical protein